MAKRHRKTLKTEAKPADKKLRQCAVTREEKPAEQMIRFVLSPDSEVIADLKGKLPGRGVWITADRATLDQAVKKNVFARSFRANCKLGRNFADRVADQCERAALGLLSLANKAGELVTGFDKVAGEIAAGKAALLLHGSDASDDGKRKLDGRFRQAEGDAAEDRILNLHSVENLSMAIGKANVVHAALRPGGLADRYMAAAAIVKDLRPREPLSGSGNGGVSELRTGSNQGAD